MPLKYCPEPLVATFEFEGTSVSFSVPTSAELVERSLSVARRFSYALESKEEKNSAAEDSDGSKRKPSLDVMALHSGDYVELVEGNLRFMAGRLLKIEGLESHAGENLDASGWSAEGVFRFLLWLYSESAPFQDWMEKYLTAKKKP